MSASPTAVVSFYGVGVTIDLAYPEEAHPAESVWHNITIMSSTTLTLRNFTVVIKAPVNSGWQVVFADKLPANFPLSANVSFEWPIQTDILPQETNGKLSCLMYVNTSQSADYAFYNVYTTEVREMTYSKLLAGYNVLNNTYYQLLANFTTLSNTYTDLRSNYETLNSSYNNLLAEYNILNNTCYQLSSDYTALDNTYNNLQSSYAALNASYSELSNNHNILNSNYNALLSKYTTLENNYDLLSSRYNDANSARDSLFKDYNGLLSDYDLLNSTRYSLQANYTSLQTVYDALNQTYIELETAFNDLQQRIASSESALDANRIAMVTFLITVVALVAFIVYLKRKKEEPYIVIRKETVSMKSEED